MEERQPADDDGVARLLEGCLNHERVVEQVPMGHHHALRRTRRA